MHTTPLRDQFALAALPSLLSDAANPVAVAVRAYAVADALLAARTLQPATEVAMVPVESSSLAALGYDAARQMLRVQFINGGVFDYLDVPVWMFREFLRAPSHGSYYATLIKGRFTSRKIAPATEVA